jgi:L-iditol 2-dehydrogenase
LCLVQLARVAGARQIVAIEPLGHRREAAAAMGADIVLDAGAGDVPEALTEATGGRGVDVAFEAAGNDAAVALAVAGTKPGGRVVLAGIPAQDTITFRASEARRKGLTLMLSRRMRETYPRATRLAADGLVDLSSIVSHTFPLSQVDRAFEVASARVGLKIIVAPNT